MTSRPSRMSGSVRRGHVLACALGMLPLLGCLDREADNAPGYSANLLGADAEVPTLESDELLRARIDANDGIDGMLVPLRTGYFGKELAHYWDFGVTVAGAKPVWIFRQRGEDGKPIDFGHYDLIDSIPGDTGYTPFRMVYTVYITSKYHGEKITSPQALEDALELGLLEEPQWKDTYADWPVTLSNTELEVGPDEQNQHPRPAYYRGKVASHFKFDEARGPLVFSVEKGPIPTPNLYQLRRQDEAKALDESVWKMDLTADGDQVDSNAVFSVKAGDAANTSLWKQFDVVVPSNYVWGSASAEADLFIKQMGGGLEAIGPVIEYQDAMLLQNRPMQRNAQ